MKTISKILSVVLCLAVVMAMFVIGASAAAPCTSITYDFTTDTVATGTEITDASKALEHFTTYASDSHEHLVSVAFTKVYQGNSVGGAFNSGGNSGSGFLKLGTSSKTGKIVLTFTAGSDIDSVDIYCHTWKATGGTDKVSVNGGTAQTAPTGGTIDKLTFELTDNSNVVTIETNKRAFISKIVVNGSIVESSCQHNGAYHYEWTASEHYKICDENGCGTEVPESRIAHDVPHGTCSCGLSETSLATVWALPKDNTNVYRTSGTVVYVDGKNVYIQDGNKAICAYLAATTDVAIGDEVTVTGNYKFYNGLPELEKAVLTVGASGEAPAPLTTIAALDYNAIGKAITLTDMTIKSVSVSSKGVYTIVLADAAGNTVTWYKAKFNGTAGVGDTIPSLTGAVTAYDTSATDITQVGVMKLQLINVTPTDVQAHTCDSDGIDKDAGKHWAICSKCGAVKGDKQDHTNAWKSDTTGHYEECSVCGEKTEACTGELSGWINTDATDHWKKCTTDGCAYIAEKAAHNHTGDYAFGSEGHYQLCACGHKSAEEACADSDDADKLCDKCKNDLSCDHNAAGWDKKYNDSKHWEECKACQTTRNEAPHDAVTKNDATSHWTECACGYKSTPAAHEPAYKYEENQHWTECACGYATEKEYHTLAGGKCACGYEKVTEGYIKVTSGKLTSGKYVMVLSNGYAPTKMDGTYLLSGTPTVSGSQVTNPEEYVITLIVEGDKVTIKDASGKVIINKSGENSLVANATEGSWTWEYKDGYFRFHDGAEGDDRRYLASNSQLENKFRAYRLNSSQASSQTNTFVLYKLSTSAGNSNTGDTSAVPVAIAAALLSVLGSTVLILKKKEF